MAAGQPKPAFYAVLFLVVAGLVGFAIYRSDLFAPKANKANNGGDIDLSQFEGKAEDPAGGATTTVKEYKFKPAERLPPVTGQKAFKSLTDTDNTLRFALNVWAGWGPIIFANEGFKPGKIWKGPGGKEFKVELVLIDNPIAMRDAYASGDIHIGWATLDMIPLFMEGFVDKQGKPRDSRIMPRVYQQVDWSNGGDGIVVREAIRTVRDLSGKSMVLAQNSPSHYFALNMLVSGGVQPADVNMTFTEDAFHAAAAFNAQRNEIDAVVSWAPDIYALAEAKGNRMLVTTADANKLIADVWFARADFAEAHPDIIEALVRGIFDGMEALKDGQNKAKCAEYMAAGYSIQAKDAMSMFADAHNTNWADNYQFFLNQNNPANFEQVWTRAYYLYRKIGSITHQPVSFDQVMDYSLIEKLGKEQKYKSQVDEYRARLTPRSAQQIEAESPEILARRITIHFFPNSADLNKKITKEVNGKTTEVAYDPNVDLVLKEAGALAAQFGGARIVVEGHTDASRLGEVPEDVVKALSQQRAEAVQRAMVERFDLEPSRITAVGYGWDRPAEEGNHAENRRVEIKVFAAEKPE
jgi:ABC-type nitrate/sulfonate/bicarbonate transport system substrate-binding protein/outer membrane protein OmpA-like peptidoglycan-associated protein